MTDREVVLAIVRYLGRAAMIFGAVTGMLIALIVWLSRGKGSVDAAAVALAGLPALLASTRTTPNREEVEAVLAPLAEPGPGAEGVAPSGG